MLPCMFQLAFCRDAAVVPAQWQQPQRVMELQPHVIATPQPFAYHVVAAIEVHAQRLT